MRILRWRLKLAEYEYDVVYKASKTNVNADALSRNPVNFEEAYCKIIKPNKRLNPNNNDPKDAEIISKMLEESDEDGEDENFELYVSGDEKIDETSPDDDIPDENFDSIPFTQEELCEPSKLQVTEKALIHDLPKYDRIQTRSQTRNKNIRQETSLDKLQRYADKIKKMEDRNDPPDKESDIEDDKNIDNKEEKFKYQKR